MLRKRDYKTILQERVEINQRCESDIAYRIEVLLKCAEDPLYWMDHFAWALDPRQNPSELPLILYDGKQIKYLEMLHGLLNNPRDIFIDKPRDVGATVIMANFVLWAWLFQDTFNARIGSRKEEYVDKTGSTDTIMYKLDYTLDRLPSWMKPKGWKKDKNRSHLRLDRPDNDNTVIGESANPSFSRGGRQTMVIYDEIGFWPWARAAWESGGDVTNARVGMTTPPDTGKSSFAYKLLTQQSGEIEIFSFEYTDIPWKNQEWLTEQKRRRSDEEFNREVNKSYSGSVEGKVYAVDWNAHVQIDNKYDYDPKKPMYVSWDFGLDAVAMIWWQKDLKTDKVYIIDSYTNSDKTIDFYVPFITGQIISGVHTYELSDINKINLHKEWRKDIMHFGDPDVVKRNLVNKQSAYDVLRENNIIVQSKKWKGRQHKDLKHKAQMLMRRLYVHEARNQDLIDAMVSASYPRRTENSQSVTPLTKPIHDWTSHFRTSFEYFADNEPEIIRKKKYQPIKYTRKPLGGVV